MWWRLWIKYFGTSFESLQNEPITYVRKQENEMIEKQAFWFFRNESDISLSLSSQSRKENESPDLTETSEVCVKIFSNTFFFNIMSIITSRFLLSCISSCAFSEPHYLAVASYYHDLGIEKQPFFWLILSVAPAHDFDFNFMFRNCPLRSLHPMLLILPYLIPMTWNEKWRSWEWMKIYLNGNMNCRKNFR